MLRTSTCRSSQRAPSSDTPCRPVSAEPYDQSTMSKIADASASKKQPCAGACGTGRAAAMGVRYNARDSHTSTYYAATGWVPWPSLAVEFNVGHRCAHGDGVRCGAHTQILSLYIPPKRYGSARDIHVFIQLRLHWEKEEGVYCCLPVISCGHTSMADSVLRSSIAIGPAPVRSVRIKQGSQTSISLTSLVLVTCMLCESIHVLNKSSVTYRTTDS